MSSSADPSEAPPRQHAPNSLPRTGPARRPRSATARRPEPDPEPGSALSAAIQYGTIDRPGRTGRSALSGGGGGLVVCSHCSGISADGTETAGPGCEDRRPGDPGDTGAQRPALGKCQGRRMFPGAARSDGKTRELSLEWHLGGVAIRSKDLADQSIEAVNEDRLRIRSPFSSTSSNTMTLPDCRRLLPGGFGVGVTLSPVLMKEQ